MNESINWYKRGKIEALKSIPRSDRIVSILLFAISWSMILYFILLKQSNSEFFTYKFGVIDSIMLFGFWIMWFITAGLEGVLGKRFISRLFDVFGGILFATISSLWLFIRFPFNFEFFTTELPASFQFIFNWVTNDVGRVLLLLSFILHLIAMVISPIAYKFIVIKKYPQKS